MTDHGRTMNPARLQSCLFDMETPLLRVEGITKVLALLAEPEGEIDSRVIHTMAGFLRETQDDLMVLWEAAREAGKAIRPIAASEQDPTES